MLSMNQFPPPVSAGYQKPGKVQAIAILTLISGISNILWMLIVGVFILVGGLSSFGIGCLLMPLVVPPIVLGIFEILYAVKLLPTPIRPTRPSNLIAILEIICILTTNPVPLAAGIVALVMYNDPEVSAYFQHTSASPAAAI
jgi:hypothetical protein